jgi:DNA-directed RNA polymerase subunit RPC12/RpoP
MKCPICSHGVIFKTKQGDKTIIYKCSYCRALLTEVEYLQHQILQGEK